MFSPLFLSPPYINVFGRIMEMPGIKVIRSRSRIITRINLMIPEHTVSRLLPPTLAATNRLIPRGGVINPNGQVYDIINPK